MNHPTPEQPADIVARLRATYRSGRTAPVSGARHSCAGCARCSPSTAPISPRPSTPTWERVRAEAFRTEIDFTVREIDHTLDHLAEWLRPEPAPVPAHIGDAQAWTQYDPLGVVLVIAPWNYPVQLLLAPVVGALAAGNAVVAKPSELAPATSAVLARLLPQYLDTDAVAVVEGGVPETTALLAERFDHIFYTGNGTGRPHRHDRRRRAPHPGHPRTGRQVARVRRPRHRPRDGRRPRSRRGKFLNAGQTCVAPDYVLTDPETAPRPGARARRGRRGAVRLRPGHLPRVRPDRQRAALRPADGAARLRAARWSAAAHDRARKYIAPTVLADVAPDAPGDAGGDLRPVLPIVTVAGLDEAIAFINDRDKPLALYAFTESDDRPGSGC